MDSNQEAANLAQIKSYRLNIWLLIIAIIQIVSPYFVIWFSRRNQAPPTSPGTVFMVTGGIPIMLLVCSSAVTSIALIIVATKRLRTKRLLGELKRLETELTHATAKWEQPDQKMLQLLSKEDREEIQEAVVVRGVQFRNEIEYSKRYVDFVFAIHNESHYDIAIDDKLGEGQIVFNKERLVKGKEIVDHSAQNVPPRSSGHFTIRQYLDAGDIDLIKSASGDRQFEFHDVKVKIKGGATSKGLIEKNDLRIDCYLSKENPTCRNYNGPFLSRFNGELVGMIREVFFQSVRCR
jgi:hypothetical protein